jgi:transcriptional regulator with XRE-family HTH domain
MAHSGNAGNDDAIVRDVRQSREQRAQAFAEYLKERLIDWQYRTRRWVTSATEVGKLLGVSDVTANDWLRGKTLPRREHCLRIAHVLGVSPTDVLEAAGYPPAQDDSYNTYAILLDAVEHESTWPQEKRERVRDAVITALSPDFAFNPAAAEWNELATLVLQQKSSPLAKAEKIAHIIDLWHHADQA